MGVPTDTHPSDVAIDYAKVTAVPEIVEAVSTNDVTIKLTVTRQGQSSESQNSSKFKLAKFKVTNKDFTGDKTGKIIEAGGKFFIAGTTNQLPLRTSFADFSLESGTANYLSTNITSYSYGSLTFSNDASNCFVVSGQFVEKWTKNKKKNVRFGIMDAAGTGKVASQDVLVQGKITVSGKGADESQPESGVSGVMNQ
ncbi:hypothetical protein SDC9_163398 [bioreactor metagenome]|uniref:Uncharacterized protein n=1 Tax=bioreactor metagenome TaxID=1076179 RepID=A0A645FQ08_9ZZZZ